MPAMIQAMMAPSTGCCAETPGKREDATTDHGAYDDSDQREGETFCGVLRSVDVMERIFAFRSMLFPHRR